MSVQALASTVMCIPASASTPTMMKRPLYLFHVKTQELKEIKDYGNEPPDIDYPLDLSLQNKSQSSNKDFAPSPSLKRPCQYSFNPQSKLTRHLKLKHGNEAKVQKVLKASKVEQSQLLMQLRKEGMHKANDRNVRMSGRILHVEKASTNMDTKENNHVRCSKCLGYIEKELIVDTGFGANQMYQISTKLQVPYLFCPLRLITSLIQMSLLNSAITILEHL